MAVFTANSVVKTLTVHKDDCHWVPRPKLRACGCGETGGKGSQIWWCEDHFSTDQVNEFMRGKFWAVVLCDTCCRE